MSKSKIAKPMLVKLPELGDLWNDTGEGGLAFYFVVKKNASVELFWSASCIISPNSKYFDTHDKEAFLEIDCAMLIGSTKHSLWNDYEGEYFYATPKTLTDDGKLLYEMLKQMYGKVDIVTLLDT